MKRILGLFLLTACVTAPTPPAANVLQFGGHNVQFVNVTNTKLGAEDWTGSERPCVTHLYHFRIEQDGSVTGLKLLDASAPLFQSTTEETLKTQHFEPGKPAEQVVEMVYERGETTRMLLLPEPLANEVLGNFKANREALNLDPNKKHPTTLSRSHPQMPKEMALRGQSGFIIMAFDLDAAGVPQNIRVVDEYPEGKLESSGREALKKWRYATLEQEPQSRRSSITEFTYQVVGSPRISTCDLGLKRNRLASAGVPLN